MDELFNEYIENHRFLISFKNETHKNNKNRLAELEEILAVEKKMFKRNNEILDECVFKYKDDLNLITPEVYDKLFEFTRHLSNHDLQIDCSLACEIHQILLLKAQELRDPKLLISENYAMGMAYFYLNSNVFCKEIFSYFKNVLVYFDSYFKLDKNSRELINRSLNNVTMAITLDLKTTLNYKLLVSYATKGLVFWKRPDVIENDPDFPFDGYIFSTRINLMSLINIYLESDISMNYKRIVHDSINLLMKSNQQNYNDKANVDPYFKSCFAVSEFSMNLITYETLIDQMVDYIDNYNIDLDPDNLINIMQCTSLCINYLLLKPSIAHDIIITRLNDKIINQMCNLPISLKDVIIQNRFFDYISALSGNLSGEDMIKTIINVTILRQVHTYIHTLMVRYLSEGITNYLFDHEYFDILLVNKIYTTRNELVINRDRFISIVTTNAILHDIGKISCIEAINNCSRNLVDCEYELIRLHPLLGYHLLMKAKIDHDYLEGCYAHHVSYDQMHGYPTIHINLNFTVIVDIIGIADSLDAATDPIGRGYQKTKTLSEVIEELKKEAGTRYNPDIVSLFDQSDFTEMIQKILNEKRLVSYNEMNCGDTESFIEVI